ncbi:hypothetical protein ACFOEQ_10965 [Chryseobacterium arachidis]|uniref:hypothetical protein n=1 Tax=Chryseobacterium arachidis TaxID=1416778 RepID=UPI00360EECC7
MTFQNISKLCLTFSLLFSFSGLKSQDKFPDGTAIPKWFKENKPTDINKLGKKYIITDFGVKNDSTILQTKQVQNIIDEASKTEVSLSYQKEPSSSVLFSLNREHTYI